MKSKIKFLPAFLLLLLLQPLVFSATLKLNRIGALDTGGMMYSEWWYTGVNPTFSGTAESNSSVTLDAGENDYDTTSDGSGAWSIPTQLSAGDYTIVIAQGSESYTFTLHLGQNLPADLGGTTQTTESTGGVPSTGFNQTVALSFGVGVMLLASYLYISSDTNKRAAFERRIIKED